MMELYLISTIKNIRACQNGRYHVVMGLYEQPEESFYLTQKQAQKLDGIITSSTWPAYSSKAHPMFAVVDTDRFVWSGNRRDYDWLLRNFEIRAEDLHVPAWAKPPKKPRQLAIPTNIEIPEELKDE